MKLIKTKNPYTKKTNFFKGFKALRRKSRLDFWKQIFAIWGGGYTYVIRAIAFRNDLVKERKRQKMLANLSARLDMQYLKISRKETEEVLVWTDEPGIVEERLKNTDFITTCAKTKDFPLDMSFLTEDNVRISHSKLPVPAALANVLCYTKTFGVDVFSIVAGKATVGFVQNREVYICGPHKDKMPRSFRKDTVYVYRADMDILIPIPRAKKEGVIEIDEVRVEELEKKPEKPDLILYSGPAGTGKTTQMLLALKGIQGPDKEIIVSAWTGKRTQDLSEICDKMELKAKAMTLHSFLNAVPEDDKGEEKTEFLKKFAAAAGAIDFSKEIYLAIDEISLVPAEVVEEVAKLRKVARFNILAAGDYEKQGKNHSFSLLRSLFNVTTIQFTTRYRPKAKTVTVGQIGEEQLIKAAKGGQTLVYQNRTVKRAIEKPLKKTGLVMCTKNCWKVNLALPKEQLENPDVTKVVLRICNGQQLKKIGDGLYKTKKGEIVAFSPSEEEEILDIPAISVQKAQGLEVEKILFIVQPFKKIIQRAFHVVITRATKIAQIAVIPITAFATPPPSVT